MREKEDRERLRSVRSAMIQRCTNPKNSEYHNYGGRGITICNQWMTDRESFIEWAFASGYRQGLSIDRIDNNGNYCPENCRWATPKEQAANMRKNLYITLCGETHMYSDWPAILGLSKSGFRKRLELGWSEEKIVNTPKGSIKGHGDPSKAVDQYTRGGIFVRRWSSASEAERVGGFHGSHIRACCNGKRKAHRGYIWKDAED